MALLRTLVVFLLVDIPSRVPLRCHQTRRRRLCTGLCRRHLSLSLLPMTLLAELNLSIVACKNIFISRVKEMRK